MDSAPDAVLLYDGFCGFCDRAVQFVLVRDNARTLRFAPLQGEFARGVLERHPQFSAFDSLMVVSRVGTAGEHVAIRSDAVVAVWRYLGGVWAAASTALRVIPRPLRDAAYDVFARHRHGVFGKRSECRVPAEAQRARFIP